MSLLSAAKVFAQPTLPDIECSYDKGSVFLIWNCQFAGVKSIEVFRSADSITNYSLIGYVKKLNKGTQTFLDSHPAGGKEFYRLSLIFKSGVKWSTNYCSIITPMPEKPEPPKLAPVVNKEVPANANIPVHKPQESSQVIHAVADTPAQLNNGMPVSTRRKILIASDDPATRSPETISSNYIFTDLATGHVLMEMPDDIKEVHYSIKFYNAQNLGVVEVPRVNQRKAILDKRNFQKKGSYKFIIRKDGLEIERGYININ